MYHLSNKTFDQPERILIRPLHTHLSQPALTECRWVPSPHTHTSLSTKPRKQILSNRTQHCWCWHSHTCSYFCTHRPSTVSKGSTPSGQRQTLSPARAPRRRTDVPRMYVFERLLENPLLLSHSSVGQHCGGVLGSSFFLNSFWDGRCPSRVVQTLSKNCDEIVIDQ